MHRLIKWIGIGSGALVGLAVIAASVVWIAGGRVIYQIYDTPPSAFVSNRETADTEAGRRAALVRGCFQGCHGDGLEGAVFVDDLLFGRIVAPDLTRAFSDMSDEELDRVIRRGVRPDGRSTLVMPSASFYHLSDADLNNITAFIRGQPNTDGPTLEVRPGLLARFFILSNFFEPQAKVIQDEAPWMIGEPEQGRYLALTVCGECHGMDLQGLDFAPSLAAVIAYGPESFRRLMREGVALGDRQLELMSDVALGRFKYFTDAEIDALYTYLRTLANNQGS